MKISFIGKSLRENEHRLPLHPAHLEQVPPNMRPSMHFDIGYGSSLGLTDEYLISLGFHVGQRSGLLSTSDIVVIPKPMEPDLEKIKKGAIIWGWLHFVLYGELADICIDRKHTVVTWEGMYENKVGVEGRPRHIFSGNNELAGYAGTVHALGILGIDGYYGRHRKVAVLGYGYAGHASVRALMARGFSDITVYTQRPINDVNNKVEGVQFEQISRDVIHGSTIMEKEQTPLWKTLKDADIIVNCGGQDPENPFMYLLPENVSEFDHNCLIIDISCDPGMGFPFIRTTTFEDPIYQVGRIKVCAVDHTPGFLWDASTWQISKEVLSFIPTVVGGRDKILNHSILSKATEIKDGVVLNKKIISYQSRSDGYPHLRLSQPSRSSILEKNNA